jgi:hypothetical protein
MMQLKLSLYNSLSFIKGALYENIGKLSNLPSMTLSGFMLLKHVSDFNFSSYVFIACLLLFCFLGLYKSVIPRSL